MSSFQTRDSDMIDLRILDLRDHERLKATEIGRRLRITRNAVVGRIYRMQHEELPCACTKPENRDGGMPRGWWQ